MNTKPKSTTNELAKDKEANFPCQNDSIVSNKAPSSLDPNPKKRDSSFQGNTQIITEEYYKKLALRNLIGHIFIQVATTVVTALILFAFERLFLNFSDTLMSRFILNFFSSTLLIFFFIVGNCFINDIKYSTGWSIFYNCSFGNSLGLFWYSLGNEFLGYVSCLYFGILTILGIFFISTYAFHEIIIWKICVASTIPCLLYSILIYLFYQNILVVVVLDLAYCYYSFTVVTFGMLVVSYDSQFYDDLHPALPSFQCSAIAPWFSIRLLLMIQSVDYKRSPKKLPWR